MTARRFFLRVLIALTTILVLLGLSNWFVNPLGLFSSPDIEGFNKYKTAFFLGSFVSKPYVVSQRKPDGIILGTSRAGA